ncbi:serine hydrolase domain-containing protein [Pseudozobellia thermophila]|uniref:CubicO group peptidase, beta-lactamase class C family n=1 Tax=Pseudozobellia thermophila TaxID=192903 RepID=A0A1M6CPS5_9FLAO|nr:serine hydrolase domain-containing protein [Pseudozobellia thermophila]SHI62728.1 CubicO group peptidase, beta-lactamase class C family [Pseudozobellia thermophila]
MKTKLITLALTGVLFVQACKENKTPTAKVSSDPPSVVTEAVAQRIDSTLKKFVDTGNIAGVSALIFEKDKEVYFNAFGYADREARKPMARNTIVQIYSMTKPVTGTALMTLYEQGKFELDDPLSKFAPEFADMMVYEGEDASGNPILSEPHRPISIRDITRHTAGFAVPGDGPLGRMVREADALNRNNTLAQMAEKMGKLPLQFQPGTQWLYGPCVDVQAFLVERISGVPYQAYVREHVLDKLDMGDTRYFIPEEDRGRFAALYRRQGEGVLERDTLTYDNYLKKWPLTRGGSGLTSTLDDYMRFARMLVNGGHLDSATVLQPETVGLMATNHLPDSVTERHFLPSKGQVGFGIDFAVRIAPPATTDENNGVVGEFFWDGAASTLFWVDPVNELTAVLFVQLFPYDPIGLHRGFREAIYGPVKSGN